MTETEADPRFMTAAIALAARFWALRTKFGRWRADRQGRRPSWRAAGPIRAGALMPKRKPCTFTALRANFGLVARRQSAGLADGAMRRICRNTINRPPTHNKAPSVRSNTNCYA
jgi:hypothetical protein